MYDDYDDDDWPVVATIVLAILFIILFIFGDAYTWLRSKLLGTNKSN
jgi:hypothetical protein